MLNESYNVDWELCEDLGTCDSKLSAWAKLPCRVSAFMKAYNPDFSWALSGPSSVLGNTL